MHQTQTIQKLIGYCLLKLVVKFLNFFADPLGRSVHNYPHVYKNMRRSIHEGNQILMNKPIQSANSVLRGLYCIYVAHVIISSKFPIVFKVNDHDMMRFAKHMML